MRLIKLMVFTALMICLYSCQEAEQVKIKPYNFNEEIGQFQNLEFITSKDAFPDTILNKWIEGDYLQIKPSVKGKYKFVNSKTMLFSPAEGFAPSTEYKIEIKTLPVFDNLNIGSEPLTVHTPWFNLDKVQAGWTKSDDKGLEVIATLFFNYPISEQVLKKYLTVEEDDKNLKYYFASSGDLREHIVKVSASNWDIDVSHKLKYKLSGDFEFPGSERELGDDQSVTASVPARERFMVTELKTDFNEGVGMILVYMSQPVLQDANEIKKLVKISPQLEWSVEKHGQGFKIKGDFQDGKSYEITLDASLKGTLDRALNENFKKTVSFGEKEPYLAMNDKTGYYLSSKGQKNLGFTIINIPEIEVTVFKIFENNLIQYFRNGKDYDYEYINGKYYDFYNYPLDGNYGSEIYKETIPTESLSGKGNVRFLNLDLDKLDHNSPHKGMYLVKVCSEKKRWLKEVQLVSLSDIGLVVKRGKNNMMVFANSIVDAKPLADVEINFVSTNNQQVFKAKTNAQGVATLDDMKSKIGDFQVGMITASKENDYNFIILNKTRVGTSRYDVGGKYINDLNYDMFVYGDRDLYRPGDSAHFNIITRTKDWQVVKDMPLKVKIVAPNGKILYQLRKQLDDQGTASTSMHIPADVMTGKFNVQILSANDVLIKNYSFMVEEFMPDRISVKATLDTTVYEPTEQLDLDVLAMNLYGTPAANRNYEVEFTLNKKQFYSKDFSEYTFDLSLSSSPYFRREMKEGKTNKDGKAVVKYKLPTYRNIGQVQGKVYTTVFDETGRPVNRQSTFELFTQNVFLGIKYFDYYVDTQKELNIPVIAVTKEGELAEETEAKVEIYRYSWETVLESRGSGYYYRSQERKHLMLKEEITIKGKNTRVNFTPNQSGRYEVHLKHKGVGSSVKKRFYAYGWGDTDYSSFEVDNEGRVEVDFDSEEYKVGDEAKVLFKTPYDGQLLVTIEQDDVLEYKYLQTSNKAAMLKIPLKDKHMPNIFVSATAIRKMDGGTLPLTIAHGYGTAKVNDPKRRIDVQIDAPEKVRSKSKQSVKIKTKPGSKMTIAVVDEGILQISNFQTPAPFDYFYQQRALGVSSYDMYEYLLPELMSNSSSASGGAGYDMGKRVNPFANDRVKLIAFWSGIVQTDRDGEFTYEFEIPRFSGALRVMAVSWDGNHFGADERKIKVADPLVMSTALPRFMTPGDKVLMPVILSNTTDKATEVDVKVETKSNLQIEGADRMTLNIEPQGEAQAKFWISAPEGAGTSQIKVYADAFNETFDDQINISIRPTAGLLKYSQTGIMGENEVDTLKTTYDMIPSTVATKVVLSSNPMIEMTSDLKELIGYPYGCLEQTTSKAFPQIYIKDLMKSAGIVTPGKNPDYFVQQAIYKIQGMQRYDGSFSYWPGGNYSNWWASVYATHFLMEATENGFEVNQKVLDKAKDFIRKQAKNKESSYYYYYDTQAKSYYEKRMPSREIFYSLFLQALDGKPDRSLMNFYKRDRSEITIDSRYMLAASFALIGDKKSYQELLPTEFDESKTRRLSGGSFGSDIRNQALSLYVLLKTDPDNIQIPHLAKTLKNEVKSSRWLSTQERVFTILAMSQFANQNDSDSFNAAVVADDEIFLESNGQTVSTDANLFEMDARVETTGEGKIFYYYSIEGVGTKNEFRNEDNYLKVRKRFFNRNGFEIKNGSFEQNDLIIVELTVRTTDKSTVENVVMTDLLPACFEIENPRLNSDRQLDWLKSQGHYDYMDIRDDRINYFLTVNNSTKRYYYQVRVVSKGEYIMGPVSADAMYDGEYYSYSGAGVVNVK